MSWLLGTLGGVLLIIIPTLCLRAFSGDDLSRVLVAIIAFSGLAGIILALLLVGQKFIVALPAAIITLAAIMWWNKNHRHDGVDFVVEGPLLGDSAAPELVAHLAAVEAEEQEEENSQPSD